MHSKKEQEAPFCNPYLVKKNINVIIIDIFYVLLQHIWITLNQMEMQKGYAIAIHKC